MGVLMLKHVMFQCHISYANAMSRACTTYDSMSHDFYLKKNIFSLSSLLDMEMPLVGMFLWYRKPRGGVPCGTAPTHQHTAAMPQSTPHALRGRLVRRMISEGMESVKGIGIWRNWNGMLSGLTSCLVDRKWNGICQRNWNMCVWFAEELEWNAEK